MYFKLIFFFILFAHITHGWSYHTPNHWPPKCTTSRSQSPIPLPQPGNLPIRGDIDMHYTPVPLKIMDDGHGTRIKLDNSGYVTVPNLKNRFYLKEAVFHTPSEHWIGQTRYDMEVQLVHQSTSGDFLNIAILCDFEEHATSHFLDEFIAPFIDLQAMAGPFPHIFTPPRSENWKIDMADFWDTAMRGLEEYYNYEGSLTRPPCTEQVQWVVSGHICLASKQWGIVMNTFTSMHGNSRGLQPENNRKVETRTTKKTFGGDSGGSGARSGGGKSKIGSILPFLLLLLCCCCGAFAYQKSLEDDKNKRDLKYHEFDNEDSVKLDSRYSQRDSEYTRQHDIGGAHFPVTTPYDDESNLRHSYLHHDSKHRDSPSPISRTMHGSPARSNQTGSHDSVPYDTHLYTTTNRTNPVRTHNNPNPVRTHNNPTMSKHSNGYVPRSHNGPSPITSQKSPISSTSATSSRPELSKYDRPPRNNHEYERQTRPTHERLLTGESAQFEPVSAYDAYRGPQYRQFSHERYGPNSGRKEETLAGFNGPNNHQADDYAYARY